MKNTTQEEINRSFAKVFWDAEQKTVVGPHGRVANDIIFQAHDSIQKGAYADAKALIASEKFLQNDPVALQVLALALIGLDKNKDASEILEKAIQDYRRQMSIAFTNLAVSKFNSGNIKEALSAAQQAREYDGSWCGPWINLMMIYCECEDWRAIQEEVEEMKQAWPAWEADTSLQERIEMDASLRFLRNTEELRILFAKWLD